MCVTPGEMNHLKYLAVVSNDEVGHGDVNTKASGLLKQMACEIKLCTSARKGSDLVFRLPQADLLLPKQHLKEHVETRWERFARAKGIKKRRRSGLVYDEDVGEYIPRYGPHSKKNRVLNAAVKDGEVAPSAIRRARKKNIEKNKANRLANISRAREAN